MTVPSGQQLNKKGDCKMSEHNLVATIRTVGNRTIRVFGDAPWAMDECFEVLLRMCADGPVMDRSDNQRFQYAQILHGDEVITSMNFDFREYFSYEDPLANEWGGRDIDFVRTKNIVSIVRGF